jgi:hypothetical protein
LLFAIPWLYSPQRLRLSAARDPKHLTVTGEHAEGGPLAPIDGPDGGPPDVGEHQAADPVAAGGLGHRRHMQVATDPPANRIGRSQPADSANINSTPYAHPGNSKNSGAHTTVPSGAWIR